MLLRCHSPLSPAGSKCKTVHLIFEKGLFITVSGAKHGNDAFYMLIVIWKFFIREDKFMTVEKRYSTLPSVHHHTDFTNSICGGDKGFVHRTVKRGGEQLKDWSQWSETCEMRGKFLLQRGDSTNTSV